MSDLGVEPQPRRMGLSEFEEQRLRELWSDGVVAKLIAHKLGRHRNTINRHRKRLALSLRKPGNARA